MDKKHVYCFRVSLAVITISALSFTIWVVYKSFTMTGPRLNTIQHHEYKKTTTTEVSKRPPILIHSENHTICCNKTNEFDEIEYDTLVQWSVGQSGTHQCIRICNESFLEIQKAGVYSIICSFQFSSTISINTFQVTIHLKRDNITEELASTEKITKGPTKIWLHINKRDFRHGNQLYVTTNSAMNMKKYSITFSRKEISCILKERLKT